jgi:hypothetical protein
VLRVSNEPDNFFCELGVVYGLAGLLVEISNSVPVISKVVPIDRSMGTKLINEFSLNLAHLFD